MQRIFLMAFLLLGVWTSAAADSPRLNIVFILADDMGWADAGCYGADLHETPSIDRLARDGVRFTDAYAMSVCSPTRSTLMTGKHAARLGFTIWAEGAIQFPKNRKLLPAPSIHNLPHSETTIASHLHSAGYLTGLVGKWHLGDAEYYPETHGFDINIGGTLWGAPNSYFFPYNGAGQFGEEFRYVPHLEFGKPGDYLPDRLTDEALRIIDYAGARPFFLYLAHHTPHIPVQAKPADIEYFKHRMKPEFHHQNPVYAAMCKSLDESVGRVLTHLEEKGLVKNTLVIFASDNGGYIGRDKAYGAPVTSNFPLRSGKGSLYEGGTRVPLIIRWPGVTVAGGVCREPVVLTDLFPTMLGAARLPVSPGVPADGRDLAPLLRDPSTTLDREALYFHYPHYYETTTPVGAIRAGDWKLLEYFEDNRLELYNLKDDPSEKSDLAAKLPDKATDLQAKLAAWRTEVGAKLPTTNPDFKPGKKGGKAK